MTMENIRPAAPVAPWMGGKSKLAKTLIERIERIPHKTYVEPFVGMGGVFLRRGFRPRTEVANDLNGEIFNLFRILQRHYSYLMQEMRFKIVHRTEFEKLRLTDPATLTEIQRAARFLYLQRLAFGGQVRGVFGVSPDHAPRFSVTRLEPILEAAHERLDGVVFECLDWSDLVARYDTADTLFYLDPPYHGGEDDYGKGMFERADFQRMADQLAEIKGKFILSINDTPEIREVFSRFILDEVRLTYTVGRKAAAGKSGELIISNHVAPAGLI